MSTLDIEFTKIGDAAQKSAGQVIQFATSIERMDTAANEAAVKLTIVEAKADLAALALGRFHHAGDEAAASNAQVAQSAVNAGNSYEALSGSLDKASEAYLAAGKGMATMTIITTKENRARQESIDLVMKESEALQHLATTNVAVADRAANSIALLSDAWKSGMEDLSGWMTQWNLYYEGLERMIALNPGTKIAKDLQLVVDALLKLRTQVTGGQVKQNDHVNF